MLQNNRYLKTYTAAALTKDDTIKEGERIKIAEGQSSTYHGSTWDVVWAADQVLVTTTKAQPPGCRWRVARTGAEEWMRLFFLNLTSSLHRHDNPL